jgi:secreted trypsin-like serine protease
MGRLCRITLAILALLAFGIAQEPSGRRTKPAGANSDPLKLQPLDDPNSYVNPRMAQLTELKQRAETLARSSLSRRQRQEARMVADEAAKELEDLAKMKSTVLFGVGAEVGQFPFQVGLVRTSPEYTLFTGLKCGGTLIAPEWVLTARHCLDGVDINEIRILVGATHLKVTEGQLFEIARVICEPGFNPQTNENDVALIKIKGPGVTDPKKLVHLATPNLEGEIVTGTRLATVVGWGVNDPDEASHPDSLLWGPVKVIPRDLCNMTPGLPDVKSTLMCAGSTEANQCSGDSGGPLLMSLQTRTYQVGIVSFGAQKHKCTAAIPGAYTRVAAHYEWIRDHCENCLVN